MQSMHNLTHCGLGHHMVSYDTLSKMAQVMACCLTAPSQFLNQYWLILNKVKWHCLRANLQEMIKLSNNKMPKKNTDSKLWPDSLGMNELTLSYSIILLKFQISFWWCTNKDVKVVLKCGWLWIDLTLKHVQSLYLTQFTINSLVTGRYACKFECVIFKLILYDRYAFPLNFPSGEYQKISLMISQHWFK